MHYLKILTLSSALLMVLMINTLHAQTRATRAETGTLATVAAIDKSEILISVIAANKKPSSGVADFAKMMIEQHGSNLTQIVEMANTMHAIPLVGGMTDKIKAQSAKDMLTLGALQGEQFDKAYVDAMVKGHQGALDLIDQQLMKTAKSQEMKTFLTDTRAVVAHHLEAAKKLQADMNS